MDIKRLFAALVLSFIFIVAWDWVFPRKPIEAGSAPASQVDAVNQTVSTAEKASMLEDVPAPTQKDFKVPNVGGGDLIVTTPLMQLEFANQGSSIRNVKIIEKNTDNTYKHKGVWEQGVYNEEKPVTLIEGAQCNPCLIIDEQVVSFINRSVETKDGLQIISSCVDAVCAEQTIKKQTIVYDDSYTVEHVFYGLPEKDVMLYWDQSLQTSERLVKDDMSYFSVYAQNKDSYKEEYLSSIKDQGTFTFDEQVGWAGLKSKYFIQSVTNNNFHNLKTQRVVFDVKQADVIDGVQTMTSSMAFYYNARDLRGGKLGVSSYTGPIDLQYLNQEQNSHLSQLFGFGWFFIGYLGKGIMWLLTTLYSIIPNYGVVCILFAFIIRFFTGPLTKKSFLSNQKMQAIQPKLKKIQDKYKDDTARLNQEIMGLYKKEGVNPLGGCLPILVQMPLLIALFQVFRKTIEFRGAPFLPFWITDLSQPDVIIQFDFLKEIWGISYFFGHGIALLPIIMGVVMFLNMKMTATNNINPSQTSTMYIMNGFFILLFNTFPSGLNLYYTVYNVLNFLQQRKLQKLGL